MATKKSASKKGSAKKSAKKSVKKTSAKLPPPAQHLTCIQRCIIAYRRCLTSGQNPVKCHINLVRCTLRCVGVVNADINKVLKQ
jgi:hypothetical protein